MTRIEIQDQINECLKKYTNPYEAGAELDSNDIEHIEAAIRLGELAQMLKDGNYESPEETARNFMLDERWEDAIEVIEIGKGFSRSNAIGYIKGGCIDTEDFKANQIIAKAEGRI